MDTLNRFSNRVENYVRYRPSYPMEIVPFLKEEGILTSESVIADIGSGTGISAEMFLKNGNVVYGVEPNKEMRDAAQKLLKTYTNFCSMNATAEGTMLPTEEIDLIISGQAFHWFDKQKSKIEFERILKPEGYVVLMWNDRRTDRTTFLQAYEAFIKKFAIDYLEVNHKNIDEASFNDFYDCPNEEAGLGKENYKMKSFDNFQYLDLDGLKGRILSSSYMPDRGHKNFDNMMREMENVFNRFQENGKVTIEYDTKIYYGKLK